MMHTILDFLFALQCPSENSSTIIRGYLLENPEAVNSYLHNPELEPTKMTALGYAVSSANVSAVEILMSHGANVNQPISNYGDVTHFSHSEDDFRRAHTALEEALAESQSFTYQDDPDTSFSSLFFEARCPDVSKRKNCIEIINLLLRVDIDLSNQVEWVKTLAMAAPESWPLVLAKGLSLHATNVDTGYNAITSIIMSKVAMGDILISLIKMGVSVNHIDRAGDTPLLKLIKRIDFATDESWQMMLHELLTAPALDLTICDASGKNVFHYVGLLPEESIRLSIQGCLDAYALSREIEVQRKTPTSYFFGVPKDITNIVRGMVTHSGMQPR